MKKSIFIFLYTACSIAAHAQNDFHSTLRAIEENSPVLKSLRLENEASLDDMKSENTIGAPSVEYSPFYQKGYNGIAESELIVSEDFDFPTKYISRHKQAKLYGKSLSHEYDEARCELLLEAGMLCLDLIRINRTEKLLAERMKNSEAILDTYIKRLDNGDADIISVNKAKLDILDIRTAVCNMENERTELLLRLKEMNGGQEILVMDTVFPAQESIDDISAFIGNRMRVDNALLTAEAKASQAHQEVSVSRQEWLPTLKVGYRRNTALNESVNGFIIGASFPLISTKSKVRAAKNREQSANIMLENSRTSTECSIMALHTELQSVNNILSAYDITLLNETQSHLKKAFEYGNIKSAEYYTETNSIYQKKQAYIDLLCKSAKIYAQLHKNKL